MRELSRSQAEQALVDDVKKLVNTAQNDGDVAKKLGAAYLKKADADVTDAEADLAGKPGTLGAQVDAHAATTAATERLIGVMAWIRDEVKLAELPEGIRHAMGEGQKWLATSPGRAVTSAIGMANTLHENPQIAKDADLDAQHIHDLTTFAAAVGAAHLHHGELRDGGHTDTAARDHAFALLRADAHHIRLAARLVHRGDKAKLALYAPTAARHEVKHRAAKGEAAK